MSQEYEFIRYSRMHHIKVFLNRIQYRNYHTHSDFEIFMVLEGEGTLSLQNSSVKLQPGVIVLINPYEPHEIQGENSVLGLFLKVSRHFCRDYFKYLSHISFDNQPLEEDISGLCKDMFRIALCYLEAKPFFEIESVSLLSGFLCKLMKSFKFCILDEHNNRIRKKRNQRMERITSYINDHCSEPVRLLEIAKTEGLTVTYISHLFKDYYGINFQNYLNNLRFEKAMTLILNTNLSQMEIAMSSGFSDAKYLSGIIKKRLECSLTEYRKKNIRDENCENIKESHRLLEYKYGDEEGLGIVKEYLGNVR